MPYQGRNFRLIVAFIFIVLAGCSRGQKNQPPIASFTASQISPSQPTTVLFSSNGSRDSDGTVVMLNWDFGDGTTSTDTSPTHVFSTSGSYMVRLTVVDDSGISATATRTVTIAEPAVSVALSHLPTTVSLSDVASVEVPESTFRSPVRMGVWTTSNAVTATEFEITSQLFGTVLRAAKEVRINTGKAKPAKTLIVTATVPTELTDRFNERDEPQVFVQIFQDGGEEVLDSFELVPSLHDPLQNTLRFEIDPEMLTNERTEDGSWEAIFVIGSTRTKPPHTVSRSSATSSGDGVLPEAIRPWPPIAVPTTEKISAEASFTSAAANIAPACGGSTLQKPLDNLVVTGAFNPPKHQGVDFRAANGTEVRSMGTGTVAKVGFDERPLKRPDPRSGKMVKGWGHYIIITHTDGSQSLYAHLQAGDVKVAAGDKVDASTIIALSDNSGGSQAPHLHVEYAPNGEIFKSAAKVDPHACIGDGVAGTIEVRDNGNLADDAFNVTVNGKLICTTAIGMANTCSMGALRAGKATLVIAAITAPDDVGTYMISLGNGVTFEDGSTSVSGTLAQGAAASFFILAP